MNLHKKNNTQEPFLQKENPYVWESLFVGLETQSDVFQRILSNPELVMQSYIEKKGRKNPTLCKRMADRLADKPNEVPRSRADAVSTES